MAPEIDDSIDNIGGASPTTAQEAASELSEIDDFLLESARYGEHDDVLSALSVGASVSAADEQGRTALHMAAANGHTEIVDTLLGNGADVNAKNQEHNTPLHWAALNGHKEVVMLLVSKGASPSSLNSHDRTPVDEAFSGGHVAIVEEINNALATVDLQRLNVEDSS